MTTHPSGVSLGSPNETRENNSGTGRCANTDPLLDRINLGIEGSGPVAIMPTAESSVSTPPDSRTSPMSRIDGCPECVINTEPPRSTVPTADGFRAAYLCADCGHAWTTDWKD